MSRFYPLTVSSVRAETRDAVVICFDVPEPLRETFRYLQGQHLTLRALIDGEDVRRSYSICSAVQEERLRIAVKRVPGGVFSAWANTMLRAGSEIDVLPPSGHFNVPLSPQNRKHYLAFAAGAGITPVISLVKSTLIAEPYSRFTLIYGNHASSSVVFREELAELKDLYLDRFNLVHVLSREHQDIDLFNGRIDRVKCKELFKRWVPLDDVDFVFICGPEGMMSEVQEALAAAGMPKSKIKIELFAASIPKQVHVPKQKPLQGRPECEVTVVMDGVARSFAMEKDTESLLEAALKHGLDMRYSCKGGVCATCRCKVVEGKVDMDTNFALEDYEIARGFILSCQSYPVTDKVVVDFDQHS
jgi:ring-1,2-phenylacetyl-CoA epoxidase subunit PaaE